MSRKRYKPRPKVGRVPPEAEIAALVFVGEMEKWSVGVLE